MEMKKLNVPGVIFTLLILLACAVLLFFVNKKYFQKQTTLVTTGSNYQIGGIDLQRVRHYYFYMCNTTRFDPSKKYSLAEFLNQLFKEARKTSVTSSARMENRNAIFAMIMLLGSKGIEKFNTILIGTRSKGCTKRFNRIVLNGRRDLRLHFIYSAAIKLMSDKSFTYAIGEFKEFYDIGKRNASGFSFIDLAANLAGLKFSETAVESEVGARWAQKLLGNTNSEAAFFPSIIGLKEGYNESEFRSLYQDTRSPKYRLVLEELQSRINQLPLHNWENH